MGPAKKWTLINDSRQIFRFFLYFSHFWSFWASGGAFGGVVLLVGTPQDLYKELNLFNYPPPVSDFAASSIFRFRGILGFANEA